MKGANCIAVMDATDSLVCLYKVSIDFFLSKVSGTEEVQLSYRGRKFLDLCSGTLFGSILKQNLNAQARS